VVDASSGLTRYGYDVMSNLTSLTDAKGNTTSFEYDGFSRVKKVAWGSS
jgi:YD repeat-containing protein